MAPEHIAVTSWRCNTQSCWRSQSGRGKHFAVEFMLLLVLLLVGVEQEALGSALPRIQRLHRRLSILQQRNKQNLLVLIEVSVQFLYVVFWPSRAASGTARRLEDPLLNITNATMSNYESPAGPSRFYEESVLAEALQVESVLRYLHCSWCSDWPRTSSAA